MASLTVRNLDDPVKARLRIVAAQNGRSMEEEARQILRKALAADAPIYSLAEIMNRRFGASGGVDLPKVAQDPVRDPPAFD